MYTPSHRNPCHLGLCCRGNCYRIGRLANVPRAPFKSDRVVITGVGLLTSTGRDRESVWQAVREGRSGLRHVDRPDMIPGGKMVAAPVDIESDIVGQVRNIPMCRLVVAEALRDSRLNFAKVEGHRVGCSITAHMTDHEFLARAAGRHDLIAPGKIPWWQQWLPNTACSLIANEFGLFGPRISIATACASSTIGVHGGVRAIQDGQCDAMVVGGSEVIFPMVAAAFHNMRVLAYHDDPQQACRPFDADRSGFVMGEGAAMLVLERLDHALARGAAIYAEVAASQLMSDARHVTSLDADSEVLTHLIRTSLRRAKLSPHDIDYVNAHGTGTQQNDAMEAQAIHTAFGRAAQSTCVSANKSMLGHLVTASGAVELGITALALRDGYAPPTLNLTNPDPRCELDCVPLVGRQRPLEHALKLSVAFGGHMAAVVLRRWRGAGERRSILPLPYRQAA